MGLTRSSPWARGKGRWGPHGTSPAHLSTPGLILHGKPYLYLMEFFHHRLFFETTSLLVDFYYINRPQVLQAETKIKKKKQN